MKYMILSSIACLFSAFVQANNCNVPVKLLNTDSNKQIIPLSGDKKMHLERWVSQETVKPHAAVMAINITCQKLEGVKYTGSKEEWYGLLNSITKGFVQRKATDISLTLVGDDKAVYRGNEAHQEYVISATLGGNEQVIYNITWLDFFKNTALTVSVSGNILIDDTVNGKYRALVKTIAANL
ncbi:hypothetical protein [Pseudoalteromonas citrea]|nr:hypothetical protein [Pseudoalteromonas citrea]